MIVLLFLKSMKENQERAEVERSRNIKYGGITGSSTELNDFLSDDKEQGSLNPCQIAVRLGGSKSHRDPLKN